MKRQVISGFTLKLIILLAITALYVNFIYFPLDKKIEAVTSETASYQSAVDEYAVYWLNPSLLDKKIADLRNEIYQKGRTSPNANPTAIADDISKLLSQTGAKLDSLSVGDLQNQNIKSASGKSTLYSIPIQIKLSSPVQNSIAFVNAIEKFKTGAYTIDNISYNQTDGSFSVSMEMKFFTSAG